MKRTAPALFLVALTGLSTEAQTGISQARLRMEAVVPAPPGQDADDEGFLDNEEFIAGTDAHIPDSFLALRPDSLLGTTTGLVIM